MRFDVVTLFPEMFDAMRVGVTGRAVERGQVELHLWNPRDYTSDVHRTVDDRPYGGGPGMVMKVEPLRAALDDAKKKEKELFKEGKPIPQPTEAELREEKLELSPYLTFTITDAAGTPVRAPRFRRRLFR